MSTSVVMPQMGESIAEGTIVRWIKKVGDTVDRDEPLFEISTDKVDAEIPSPAAGVLTEIKVHEGETVAVNEVVAMIGVEGEVVAEDPEPDAEPDAEPQSEPAAGAEEAAASTQPQADGATRTTTPSSPTPVSTTSARRARAAAPGTPAASPTTSTAGTDGRASAGPSTDLDARRQKSSPLVRRIAKEHQVDIGQIHGSGLGGRVTKHDILEFIEEGTDDAGTSAQQAAPPVAPAADARKAPRPQAPAPVAQGNVEIKPLSIIRRKIAEHMILSRRTSAHVHSVFHVNFSTVEKIRQQKKGEYERLGARLTYMTFIAKAVVDALRNHPIVNASLDGDNVIYKKDINLGIAVALDTGLIVPVIKHADERNLLGLSRAIADVAERARAKQLKPEEVQGGTFTITNPGQFGAQFGMPIINQPQSAILGVGTVEKRAIVVDDAIAIRTMAYLTLGFDHRLIDGAVADQFMAAIKERIERFELSDT